MNVLECVYHYLTGVAPSKERRLYRQIRESYRMWKDKRMDKMSMEFPEGESTWKHIGRPLLSQRSVWAQGRRVPTRPGHRKRRHHMFWLWTKRLLWCRMSHEGPRLRFIQGAKGSGKGAYSLDDRGAWTPSEYQKKKQKCVNGLGFTIQ